MLRPLSNLCLEHVFEKNLCFHMLRPASRLHPEHVKSQKSAKLHAPPEFSAVHVQSILMLSSFKNAYKQ